MEQVMKKDFLCYTHSRVHIPKRRRRKSFEGLKKDDHIINNKDMTFTESLQNRNYI